MVESDGWFRLRWFLVGSLAAVGTAHGLGMTVAQRPPIVRLRPPPPVVAVPRTDLEPPAIPANDSEVGSAPEPAMLEPTRTEELRPADVERDRARGARTRTTPTPAPAPAPAPAVPTPEPAVPAVAAAPKPVPRDDALAKAIAALRRAPRSSSARARAERAIEQAVLPLPDDIRSTIRGCVTQASFESSAVVVAEHLADCAERLQKARR